MIEPSNADLQSCPESVQNYIKGLEVAIAELEAKQEEWLKKIIRL